MVVLRRRRPPGHATAFQFGVVHAQRERAAFDIDRHRVAFLDERDGAAGRRLGAHVPTAGPFVAPEKRPSVISATLVDSPIPTMEDVGVSISRMPGPPLGPS